MRHVSTSVTWGDVAYYFGVLAFIAAVFAIRFGDFRRRCIERFDIDGYPPIPTQYRNEAQQRR